MACNCPQGTTLVTLPDGSQVCRQDTVVLAQGPAQGACQKVTLGINPGNLPFFGQCEQYCKYGAKFYGETSSLPWPINFFTGCTPGSQNWKDFSSVLVPSIATTSNSLWGTGAASPAFDGRYNVAGVNMDPNLPCGGVPITGRYGFSYCLNVVSPTTYCIGFGGLNVQIQINGAVWIDTAPANRDVYQYENCNVFQVTLPAGLHIIEMRADISGGVDSCGVFTFNGSSTRNPGTSPGFAFEIYNATAAVLAAMTTQIQLNAVLVYSTLNEVGQLMDYGVIQYNYRCPCGPIPPPCPDSYGNYNVINPVLDNCTVNSLNPNADPSIYVCHTYQYTPLGGCCFPLQDCQNPSNIILTNTDLSLIVGNVVTLQDNFGQDIPGCFQVLPQTDCDGTEVAVTVVQDFGPYPAGCAACLPSCYEITSCSNPLISYIVDNDLSAYVGQVIKICPDTPGSRGETPLIGTCCYLLQNCCDENDKIKVQCPSTQYFPPNLPPVFNIGDVLDIPSMAPKCWMVMDKDFDCVINYTNVPMVPIFWPSENATVKPNGCQDCCPIATWTPLTACDCFTVELAQDCTGHVTITDIITGPFVDCTACNPPCYILTNCEDPNEYIITNTNLSAYVGQVIYIDGCPGTCWSVNLAPDCNGAVPVVVTTSFPDCISCLPPVPVPVPEDLHPRRIKPGYYTPGCPPQYTEKVNCRFAQAMYSHMLVRRYGITLCCAQDDLKWRIKKQLLDLKALYDSNLCVNLFDVCCPPCAVVATIEWFNPVQCPAPSNVTGQIEIPSDCPIPNQVSVTIIS